MATLTDGSSDGDRVGVTGEAELSGGLVVGGVRDDGDGDGEQPATRPSVTVADDTVTRIRWRIGLRRLRLCIWLIQRPLDAGMVIQDKTLPANARTRTDRIIAGYCATNNHAVTRQAASEETHVHRNNPDVPAPVRLSERRARTPSNNVGPAITYHGRHGMYSLASLMLPSKLGPVPAPQTTIQARITSPNKKTRTRVNQWRNAGKNVLRKSVDGH